jgi:hypothetical protein
MTEASKQEHRIISRLFHQDFFAQEKEKWPKFKGMSFEYRRDNEKIGAFHLERRESKPKA